HSGQIYPDVPTKGGGQVKELEWRVRMACAERNIWSAAQLQRFVHQRTGVRLSVQTLQAWFRKQPVRIEVRTLISILNALACPLNELIKFEPPKTVEEAQADPTEVGHHRQKEPKAETETLTQRVPRKRVARPDTDEIIAVLEKADRAASASTVKPNRTAE